MKEIWRNFSKSQGLGGSLEFFQVLEPWRNLGIFLSPMKEYEEVWRKYDGNMKELGGKYEGIMKDIWRNMKEIWWGKYESKDSPYIWALRLGKISSSSSDLGGGGGGLQFPGLGVPQRKDMKHIKNLWTSSFMKLF